MSFLEPVGTVVTAAAITEQIVKKSNFIKRHAKRLKFLINNGNANIPIFGAGGVGKTTVGKLFDGVDPLDLGSMYDESIAKEIVKLTGDIPGKVIVAPGQVERIDRHWTSLFNEINIGKSFGFVNVVSYGYHDFMLESYKDHDLYTSGMTVEDFISIYVSKRRELELELLNKLIDGVSNVEKPVWMATLLTKQDLWYSDKLNVEMHYEKGEYNEAIDRLRQKVGVNNFQHEYIPTSLTLKNFVTKKGEVLAGTTGGYDMAKHLTYLSSMYENLEKLIQNGAPK